MKHQFYITLQEFITELRCASTSNKAFNETPISYVNPNERIVQSVENDKVTLYVYIIVIFAFTVIYQLDKLIPIQYQDSSLKNHSQ